VTKNEYLKLIDTIRLHDYCYYVEHKPVITDYEYDQLYQRLQFFESSYPELVEKTSPTQRVGEALTKGFSQQLHEIPMLSLNNTYTFQELEDFINRVKKSAQISNLFFCSELKMDGIAISVRYEKGLYVRALTRGDGKSGDDVTSNVRTIKALPLRLRDDLVDIPDVIEVRGEVFMPRNVFMERNLQMQEAGEAVWANPRNAAAGSLKLLNPHEVFQRKLSIVFYGLADPLFLESQYVVHEYLEKLGFPVFSYKYKNLASSLKEIMEFAALVLASREKLSFDIDGIVVKVDDLKLWSVLGNTGKSPRFAVAYKFAPQQAKSVVKKITVQVGRTGILTPVAELAPVFLSGSTISRATLHNEEEVIRKDIREGDAVIIEKGGDVIPKVVSVISNQRSPTAVSWRMVGYCPSCGSDLKKIPGEVAFRCSNTKECREQILARLVYFASKHAMNIDHLGEKVIEQLVDKKLVVSFSDIYRLTREKISLIDGFKEKSTQNLLLSIDRSRRVSLARFVLALGIRYIGKETAELLSQKVGDIHKIIKMSAQDFLAIDGIGEKMARALEEYFGNQDNIREIEALLFNGVEPKGEAFLVLKNHFFGGKTLVLTGALQKYSRDEAEKLIKERGGRVSPSISKKTDFVVVGHDPGSKLDKAKELKTTILTEQQFLKLL
jgi:DNA ligase (NAD+)